MSTHAAGRLRQPRNLEITLALASGRQNQDSRILADKPIPTARREGPGEQSGLRGGGHRVWRYAAGGPPRSTLGN